MKNVSIIQGRKNNYSIDVPIHEYVKLLAYPYAMHKALMSRFEDGEIGAKAVNFFETEELQEKIDLAFQGYIDDSISLNYIQDLVNPETLRITADYLKLYYENVFPNKPKIGDLINKN